jgi:hypothetical protein
MTNSDEFRFTARWLPLAVPPESKDFLTTFSNFVGQFTYVVLVACDTLKSVLYRFASESAAFS